MKAKKSLIAALISALENQKGFVLYIFIGSSKVIFVNQNLWFKANELNF